MERNDIINALECCTYGGDFNKSQVEVCSPCPYFHEGNCTDVLKENALSLIKELTEEYESMAKSVNKASDLIRQLRAEKKELTEQNEKLLNELKGAPLNNTEYEVLYKDKCEENKGLEEVIRVSIETQNRMSETIEELTEENERLRGCVMSEEQVRNIANETIQQGIFIIKADTLGELKNRLTREIGTYLSISIIKVADMFKLIGKIEDEMLSQSNSQLKPIRAFTEEELDKVAIDSKAIIETVRKMQSEIEARCIKGGIYPAFVARVIEQVAKEMMEEEK